MTPAQHAEFLAERMAAIHASDKTAKLTDALSSPDRCREWMTLSVKQDGGKNLRIMQRRDVVVDGNKVMLNGKPQTELVQVYA